VILSVILEGTKDFVKIREVVKDGKAYLYFGLDRKKIKTEGKEAMGNFLKRLQVHKSTGNVEEGAKMFEGYSVVDETYLKYRTIVLANKKPRRLEL